MVVNRAVSWWGDVWLWVHDKGPNSFWFGSAIVGLLFMLVSRFVAYAPYGISLFLGVGVWSVMLGGPVFAIAWVFGVDVVALTSGVSVGVWVVLLGLGYAGGIASMYAGTRLVHTRYKNNDVGYEYVWASIIVGAPWIGFGILAELGHVSITSIVGVGFLVGWMGLISIDAWRGGRGKYYTIDLIWFLLFIMCVLGGWGVLMVLPWVTIGVSSWTLLTMVLLVLIMFRLRMSVKREMGSYRVPYDPEVVLVFARVPVFVFFTYMLVSGDWSITSSMFIGVRDVGVATPLWAFVLIGLNGVVWYVYLCTYGDYEVFKATGKEIKEYYGGLGSDDNVALDYLEYLDEDGNIDEKKVREDMPDEISFDTTTDRQKELLEDVFFALQELEMELEKYDEETANDLEPERVLEWNRGSLKGLRRDAKNGMEKDDVPVPLGQAYQRLYRVLDQTIEAWYDEVDS